MKEARDILKFYAFRALMKRFALPVIVLWSVASGLTLQEIAVIGIVVTVLGVIFEVPSGAFSDALGHKRALILSSIGQSASMLMYLGGTFGWIFAANLTYWLAGTLLTGTMSAILYERLVMLKRGHEFRTVLSRSVSIAHGVGIVFMVLAGLTYMIHPWIPFLVGAGQYVLGAMLISTFGPTREGKAVRFEVSNVVENLKTAVQILKTKTDLFWVVGGFAIITGGLFAFFEYEQVRFSELGLVAAGIGVVYAIKRVVGVIAPMVFTWSSKRVSMRKTFFFGLSALALTFIFSALANSAWLLALTVLFSTFLVLGLEIVVDEYVNARVQTNARATILSVRFLILNISKAFGMIILGVALGLLSLQSSLLILSLVISVPVLLIFLPNLRTVREV